MLTTRHIISCIAGLAVTGACAIGVAATFDIDRWATNTLMATVNGFYINAMGQIVNIPLVSSGLQTDAANASTGVNNGVVQATATASTAIAPYEQPGMSISGTCGYTFVNQALVQRPAGLNSFLRQGIDPQTQQSIPCSYFGIIESDDGGTECTVSGKITLSWSDTVAGNLIDGPGWLGRIQVLLGGQIIAWVTYTGGTNAATSSQPQVTVNVRNDGVAVEFVRGGVPVGTTVEIRFAVGVGEAIFTSGNPGSQTVGEIVFTVDLEV